MTAKLGIESDYLDPGQVAERLHLKSRQTVLQMIHLGQLPAYDFGTGKVHVYRVSRRDLDEFIESRRTPGP